MFEPKNAKARRSLKRATERFEDLQEAIALLKGVRETLQFYPVTRGHPDVAKIDELLKRLA